MMKTLKLLFGIFLVSMLSATVAIGTYSYISGKNTKFSTDNTFLQPALHNVAYATPAENTDFTYAAEQSVNAVVHIKSVARPSERSRSSRGYIDPFEFFFGDGSPFGGQYQQRRPQVGFGSGVFISTDGYIVTNNHVIEGADEIEITTNDNKTYKAKLIGSDNLADVALLKVDGNDFHALPFGDSDAIKIGEWVLAVGNPFNLTSTVTAGIISAKGRSDLPLGDENDPQRIQSYIQTDAAVNPGNSGGALVNTKGELIGINTLILSQTGNFAGYSFAIPVNIVKKIAADLKQYGIVQRAMLGVMPYDFSKLKEKGAELKERYEDFKDLDLNKINKIKINDGAYIVSLSDNSSAQKAGVKEGDIITAINGVKVKTSQELRAQISKYSPGNKVEVQVYRDDAYKNFTVELKNDQGTTEVVKQSNLKVALGASFKELSKEKKSELDINYGLEVTDISSGKLRSAGVRNGFVILTANDNKISTSEDLENVISSVMKKDQDDRGLLLRGFYQNPQRIRIEYYAINLNDQE